MSQKKIFKTKEGSYTFYLPDLDEYYHSWFGAIGESKHVYIENGLMFFKKWQKDNKEIRILEIGLGTGLNALLTYLICEKNKEHTIKYTSLETSPLSKEEFSLLNYPEMLKLSPEQASFFQDIHTSSWEKSHQALTNFYFKKKMTSLLSVELEKKHYDVVYFDAFSPKVQPELWEKDVFSKIYQSMSDKSVLVTYSSQGQVKEAIRNALFHLERLKGALGKHHMLRALKGHEKPNS
ncbi:hypothetical protein AB834_02650 [PVC group bacterium (ex Bugula neritina AB1)]|nr:hypothetical protein AB834_02650 [PVC group bacterium (ex Bugula neritina AB1)]